MCYISCEKFTNEFIGALQRQELVNFREKYRKMDALIIDDIQFIAKKERTQEEFFHTFNTLHEYNKQIVLSSDRPPKSINSIDERLRSRFEGGMTADISHPDYETRAAILQAKVKEKGVDIPKDALEYVAEHITTNIRELEGALNILITSSKVNNVGITLAKTKQYLDHIIKRPRKNIGVKKMIKSVANFYEISEKDILSQNRKRDVAYPRQVLMYLMREELKYSFPSIGSKLGGRDHTTVIHACSKIGGELKKSNEALSEELSLIKQELYSG